MAVAAGVDWVQIREKDMATRELLALVREAALTGARIIVNDRLDVALASGAAGVHLGGESLPARDAIRWCRSGNAPAEFLPQHRAGTASGSGRRELRFFRACV